MESVPATVQYIRSIPNTHVTSYIDVTINKLSVELVKRDVFCCLVVSVIPFGKKHPPEFCCIFKPITVYTGLRIQAFNTMFDEEYADFTIFVETKIIECE